MDYEAIHILFEGMLRDENAKPTDLPITVLKAITKDFSEDLEIGNGGCAVVYKGLLGNGRTVAVKKLFKSIDMDENKYNQEVACLMRVKHKNIVRFLGYCADTQGKICSHGGKFVMADVRQRLLCFEYLSKGSLQQYISDASSGLKWSQRYQIIKGICEGLHYLHGERIVHLDLKPANILLDDDMVPKITDFGLSRCFEENQSRAITSNLAGSLGYLAPEFFRGVVTLKLDIYSLGIIIMEMLTGKKRCTPVQSVLESWRNTLDTSLAEIMLKQVRVCMQIGIDCINPDPAKRPAIEHIIEMLNETESTDEFIENNKGISSITEPQSSTGSGRVKEEVSKNGDYCSPFELQATGRDKVKLETIPRINSILQTTSCTDFAVLVRVTAPRRCSERSRLGVDLVAVLDVARSFRLFSTMDSIKEAMLFVINNLGPDDRLSIVTFNDQVRRCTELSEMSDVNREEARAKVLALKAGLGTDMGAAMQEAAKILRQRGAEEASSRVGRIMALSCNSDNVVLGHHISHEFPVETFGLGEDHDPLKLYSISDSTLGVYSYAIGDIKRIKEAFAQCIGGLTSLTAMDVEVKLEAFEGVAISSIDSGAYQTSISPDGRSGTIRVRDLYAGERKNFIAWLSIQEGAAEQLMAVSGSYTNHKINKEAAVQLDGVELAILRPTTETAPPEQLAVCPEVAAELVRFRLLKGVSETVERSDLLKELHKLWDTISASEDGRSAPKSTMSGLAWDVEEMQRGLFSRTREAKAFMPSWLTSHRLQRETTKISLSPSSWLTSVASSTPTTFRTTAMQEMLRKMDKKAFADIQLPQV